MTTESLTTGLEYISQVKKQLPDELAIMTDKLTLIKQQITDSIEQNKLKQAEILTLLLDIQGKLKTLPQTIVEQQTLLQNKIVLTANKLKKLNQVIVTQEEEMSPMVESVNKYFQKFENQLEIIKNKHLQLLNESMGIFNQLWQTVEDNYNKIDVSWLEMEQEVDILNQKIISLQDISQSHFDTTKNNLEETQETINNSIEEEILNQLSTLEDSLKEEIENSLENIGNKVNEFTQLNEDQVTEVTELITETITDFMETIEESLAIDNDSQEIEESHRRFTDKGNELEALIPNIKKLISDLEEAKDSLNI